VLSCFAGAASANDYEPQYTDCNLEFTIRGWSFVYKTMKGSGRVTCTNGQTALVSIRTHAGGLTVGKSEILGGKGKFSQILDIAEVFGTYLQGEAHAGATRSTQASAMTKGEVSLAISGTGRGIDLGLAVGAFTITPR
jgi:hypothetical protein